MKTLRKHISVGDYKFNVGVDRDIVVDCFEQFPSLVEFLLKQANGDNADIIVNAVKSKNLRQVLETNEQIADFVRFALPKMLKKAEDESDAEEILNYIYENEVDEVFNSEMFKFICSGFTPDATEKKPKVKFVMK